MTEMKRAWEDVGEALSAFGLKLKLHTEQEASEEQEEFASALGRLSRSVEDIFQGLGSAAHDPAVRDDARQIGRAFVEALDATVAEAKSRLNQRERG